MSGATDAESILSLVGTLLLARTTGLNALGELDAYPLAVKIKSQIGPPLP